MIMSRSVSVIIIVVMAVTMVVISAMIVIRATAAAEGDPALLMAYSTVMLCWMLSRFCLPNVIATPLSTKALTW
jgi:hypothetical protein